MQLAPPSIVMRPTDAHAAADVMQPSKLFALAEGRFQLALVASGMDADGVAPDTRSTQNAVFHALSGIRLLRSAIVPTTPFHQRQRASSAIVQASDAVQALMRYDQVVRLLPATELAPGRLPLAGIVALDEARRSLTSAASRLA